MWTVFWCAFALTYVIIACRYTYGFLCMAAMGVGGGSKWQGYLIAVSLGLFWPIAAILIWWEVKRYGR